MNRIKRLPPARFIQKYSNCLVELSFKAQNRGAKAIQEKQKVNWTPELRLLAMKTLSALVW